jgi:tRNA (guanosine-2'-O-)-methyltransferase
MKLPAERAGARTHSSAGSGPGPADWPEPWTPDGVIATLEPLSGEARRARILEVIERRLGSVTVLMDAPHDPHNAAAVVRSCEAFGVGEVFVVPRDEPFLVAGTVTKGTERWVEVRVKDSVEAATSELRARGFSLVATHPKGRLEPKDLRTLPKVALVLGNEHDGISEELVRAADDSVRVPMRGFVESLNVSVAAALLLHAATEGRPGDLTETERRRLYALGLVRSVPRAQEILAASRPI